jgi:hypothetical protein
LPGGERPRRSDNHSRPSTLRMSGGIPLLPPCAIMAWTGEALNCNHTPGKLTIRRYHAVYIHIQHTGKKRGKKSCRM